jgi:hypothetical protein
MRNMAIQSTKHGFTFHDLASAPYEELAAVVRLRTEPTPGQAFAAKIHSGDPAGKIEKNRARRQVFHLYSRYPKPLRLLTLPGIKWNFERGILDHRRWGRPTSFVAAECDPAIYRASLAFMPRDSKGMAQVDTEKLTFKSDVVKWYECGPVENLILRTNERFTGAWLDFNGQLNEGRIAAVAELWKRVSDSMVVTFLGSRYDSTVERMLARADRPEAWDVVFQNLLKIKGGLVQMYSYSDPVKMIQMTLLKPSGKRRMAAQQPLPVSDDYIVSQGVLVDWPTPQVRMPWTR